MSGSKYAPKIIAPVVNIRETGKDVVIEAEMSGLKKEDVSLEVKEDRLTIKGAYNKCDVPRGYEPVYRERCNYEYSRTFILGEETEAEGITAKYENGILKVTIPKTEKAQPKRIEIAD